MDIDHLHSQLVQCTSSFMQLLKLLEHEQGEDSRAIFIQGKSNISKAILQLNMLLGKPDSWMVGGVCRVRRADGGLDVALVVEILQGVLATDHDNDNDESSTTVARLCWLRPRNIYELSSRGFLVGLNDLIHFYDSDLFDSERKRIKESTKVWALVSSSSGYLELMHVTQSSPTHTYVMRPKGDDEWMLDSGEYLVLCPCVGSHTPPLATAVAEEADELEVIKPEDIFPRRSLTVGAWEQHTKGFGSKMLTRMGYKRGEGLGPEGNGITAPVEASEVSVKGAGISFTKTLALAKNLLTSTPARPAVDNLGVFSFMNNKLEGSVAQVSAIATLPTPASSSSILILQEAEGRLKDRLSRLHESLARNLPEERSGRAGDPRLAQQVSLKIQSTQQELLSLRQRRDTASMLAIRSIDRSKKSKGVF